ncbi:MAG: malate/lactate/ureidoglycolate dehydrogenase [Geminicoccales bacterium]
MGIAAEPLHRLVVAIFEHAGSEAAEAAAIADHLIEANLVGHDSHGVIRVAPYLDLLRAGAIMANRHARVTKDAGIALTVDGESGYGQVIAKEGIALGVERTRQHGVAVVALRNTSHIGRIGAWAEQAATSGLVSLHFVNTTGFGIQVAPYGGSDRRLSVNPIALGVPRPGREPIVHDMSTGIIAAGKVRVARNTGELLPEGCLIDGHGRPTRDPETFFADPPGALLPLGGHKGYGLSIFCEVLAGALTGGGSSHPDNPDAGRLVNNMLSILIDPERLAGSGAIAADLERLEAWVRASPPAAPGGEILLPGEPERRTKASRLAEGIPLDPKTQSQLAAAARKVGVPQAELETVLGGI